jgi:hypothetical protein
MRKQLLTSTLVIISIILAAPFVALHGKEMITLDGIQYRDLTPLTKKQVDCLADNIYFESGSEPREGKIAVAMVTLNRVEKGFSDTICGVVKQKTNNSSGQIVCQFSWWCETRAKNISLSKEKYQKAIGSAPNEVFPLIHHDSATLDINAFNQFFGAPANFFSYDAAGTGAINNFLAHTAGQTFQRKMFFYGQGFGCVCAETAEQAAAASQYISQNIGVQLDTNTTRTAGTYTYGRENPEKNHCCSETYCECSHVTLPLVVP